MAKAKGKTSAWLVVGIVAIVVLLGFVAFSVSQQQAGGGVDIIKETGDCQIAPYITLAVNDAENLGTTVTPTAVYYKKNGVYLGAFTSGSSGSEFSVGDEVQLLVEKANYLNFVIEDIEVTRCGENLVTATMYATDDSSVKVFNDNGLLASTNNQSASSTPIDMEFKVTANADQSSGDMVLVVEATNTTEIDKIIVSGSGVESVIAPEFYTDGANSITVAYSLPALKDGLSASYNLRFEAESGETMGGTPQMVTLTFYTAQADVDASTGAFIVGVEDSEGTEIYEDTWTSTFWLA